MSTPIVEVQDGRITQESTVHFGRAPRGRRELREGTPPPPVDFGCVPRVARLMALAIRFDRLVVAGEIRDYAELARLGHVSRARVTQIMNLLNLAPDIQEQILFLPLTTQGRDSIREWQLRPIATAPDWRKQRRMWEVLVQGQSCKA